MSDLNYYKYMALSIKLIAAQNAGDEVKADDICDELDPLWRGLSADDRSRLNADIAELMALDSAGTEAEGRILLLQTELDEANATIKDWNDNARYLLNSTHGAVRIREGGGLENPMESLIANYIALRDQAGRRTG